MISTQNNFDLIILSEEKDWRFEEGNDNPAKKPYLEIRNDEFSNREYASTVRIYCPNPVSKQEKPTITATRHCLIA